MATNSNNPRESSIRRVARFVAGVGEGNRFTKLALFDAVEGVSQADRRMRDLRDMGWVIDNYKDNPDLRPSEYLLRKIGARVDLGEKAHPSRKSIAGAKRRRVLERDGHICQVCGIPVAASYPDKPEQRARLTIGHIIPVARGGGDSDENLRAECQRCNEETRDNSVDPESVEQVLTQVKNIGGIKEKRVLYSWMQAGRRPKSDKELVFTSWSRLPVSQRYEVMLELARQTGEDI